MSFVLLAQSQVVSQPLTAASPIAAGPRCAVNRRGQVLCSYVAQSRLGVNDFVPMLAVSDDRGDTWRSHRPIWPGLIDRCSLFCSISRSPDGQLYLFGSRTPIDRIGEPFWSDATQGLKANELFWSRSDDDGASWLDPQAIALPTSGAAEVPGPLCVTREGVFVGVYAPYNTFDPNLQVQRNQLVCVRSDDGGRNWQGGQAMQLDPHTGAAEAWVVQLADGRLLATTWHVNHQPDGPQLTNKYALSADDGQTWSPTRSTGIAGHTTCLTALPTGGAIFGNVQRDPARPVGVYAAVTWPTEAAFNAGANQLLWSMNQATQGGDAEHQNWTRFTFGEPSLTHLDGDEYLLTWWHQTDDTAGVGCQRLQLQA